MIQEAYAAFANDAEPLLPQQKQIRQFILHACKAWDLRVNLEANGSLLVHFGKELAENLGVTPTQGICFTPELANYHAEYVTLGHPMLDRLLTLVKTRGETTSLLFAFSLDPTFLHMAVSYNPAQAPVKEAPHAFRRLQATMGCLNFINAKNRIIKARAINQLQVLFYFRVSCISDERQELLVPMLIDPNTELPTHWVGLEDAVSFVAPVHSQSKGQSASSRKESSVSVTDGPLALPDFVKIGQEVLPSEPYTLLRLYRVATECLEHQLATEFAAFTAEATGRLAQERQRIEEYYAGLTQETLDPLRKVFRRMASLSVRSQLTHSSKAQMGYAEQMRVMKQDANQLEAQYAQELEQLADEKALRLRELELKYESRVELHLVSTAAVHVPRLEYTYRLSGKQPREVTFFYDVLCDQVMDLACEACNQALQEVVLCSCGDVVCLDCSNECTCGKMVCTNCSHLTCHVCGRLVCDSCAMSCPISTVGHLALTVCAACYHEHCAGCQAIAGDMIAFG